MTIKTGQTAAAAVVAAFFLQQAPAAAQSYEDATASPVIEPSDPGASGLPRFATVFGVPNALPPRSGTLGFGLTYATPRNGIEGADGDGDVGVSYTLGNPISGLSVTGGLTVSGIDPLGDAGSFSLSGSRMLFSGSRTATFAGASVANLATWGGAEGDDAKGAVSLTNFGAIPMGRAALPYMVTGGYGQDFQYDDAGQREDGFFWGLGLGMGPGLSASVSGSETSVNVGATVLFPGLRGLSLTAGVMDVAEQVERRQAAFTLGYSVELGGF